MAEHCDGINDSGFDVKLMTKGKKNKRRGSEAEKINATRSPAAGESAPFIASARLAHPPHCSALSLRSLASPDPVPALPPRRNRYEFYGAQFLATEKCIGRSAGEATEAKALSTPAAARHPIFIADLPGFWHAWSVLVSSVAMAADRLASYRYFSLGFGSSRK